MTTLPDSDIASAACGGCPLTAGRTSAALSRRTFLREAGLAAASLALATAHAERALAMTPLSLHAMPRRTNGAASERRYPLPTTDGVLVDRDSSVIIARAAGHVFAFSLSCPHQNTALRWEAGDGEFRCPKHKSRYRPDGTFIDGRATRAMDRLPIRRDGDAVVVDVDAVLLQDENAARWQSAFVAV